jgi:hypothetical protein
MLADAGFVDVLFHGWTGFRTSLYTQGAHLTAVKPGGPARGPDNQRLP